MYVLASEFLIWFGSWKWKRNTINFETPAGYLSNVHGVSLANVKLIRRTLMLVRVAMPRSTSRCSVRLLWRNGLLAPTNNTDGNVTIVCTHFAKSVTQGQFTPSPWPGTKMGCIIALNVDSLAAAVVGRLVQPRVPDYISDSRSTCAKIAKLAVKIAWLKASPLWTNRNVPNATHTN